MRQRNRNVEGLGNTQLFALLQARRVRSALVKFNFCFEVFGVWHVTMLDLLGVVTRHCRLYGSFSLRHAVEDHLFAHTANAHRTMLLCPSPAGIFSLLAVYFLPQTQIIYFFGKMPSACATSTSWISSSSCLNAVRHTPWVLVQHLTGREQLLVEADPGLVSPINTACVFLRTVVLALFKLRMEKHSKIYNERDSDTHTNKALIHRMFRQDAPSFLLLLAMKLRAAALGLHTVVSDFQ